jgi:hypothetical protein
MPEALAMDGDVAVFVVHIHKCERECIECSHNVSVPDGLPISRIREPKTGVCRGFRFTHYQRRPILVLRPATR